jgi:hypothetical protein
VDVAAAAAREVQQAFRAAREAGDEGALDGVVVLFEGEGLAGGAGAQGLRKGKGGGGGVGV